MKTLKQIYTKDKNVRISFRLDGKLSEWIIARCEKLGTTPSAFMRNLAYQNFYAETVIQSITNKPSDSTERASDHADI